MSLQLVGIRLKLPFVVIYLRHDITYAVENGKGEP